jgi:hypothetical protein
MTQVKGLIAALKALRHPKPCFLAKEIADYNPRP